MSKHFYNKLGENVLLHNKKKMSNKGDITVESFIGPHRLQKLFSNLYYLV